jgi:pyruvate formate lyase activating enzyme
MIISSVLQEGSIDYPGKYGPTIFLGGCNFRCWFCHNPNLISDPKKIIGEEELLKKLKSKTLAGWYNGICISGGEPTLQNNLPEFARKLKDLGLSVKVDTNGSEPAMLERLLGIVDYIAMDIKGPKEKYSKISGINVNTKDIEKSMRTITKFPDYEFRTTIAPILETEPRWIVKEETEEMAKWIADTTGSNKHQYFLQKFMAHESLSKENLPAEFNETPDSVLDELMISARKYLPKCEIR